MSYFRDYLNANDITYEQYLQSDHWKLIRKRFWESRLHNGCCYACGSKEKLNVHHKSYKRLGRENLRDFCLLCDICHKKTHDLDMTRKNGIQWGAAKRLRKTLQKLK